MLVSEFRSFLTKSNALALAVGVIIGAAVGSVVTALVADILLPLISTILPSGDWRSSKWVISGSNAVLYGHFVGIVIDFLIIAFIVFLLTKALLRPEPAPPTKTCPQCLETVPKAATRCRACTSAL
jgi:large conductance mechanosensitive channel